MAHWPIRSDRDCFRPETFLPSGSMDGMGFFPVWFPVRENSDDFGCRHDIIVDQAYRVRVRTTNRIVALPEHQ